MGKRLCVVFFGMEKAYKAQNTSLTGFWLLFRFDGIQPFLQLCFFIGCF